MKKLQFAIFAFILFSTLQLFAQEDIVFIRSYGNTGYDYGRDIKQDNDSGYVITGSSSSFGSDNAELFLLKLDKLGDFEWSRNYGGSGSDWGQSMVVTHDSTYAVAGYTNSYGAGGFDFYLVRIGGDGTPLWERTYGGSNWDQAFGLVELPDSGFIMAGESYSYNDGIRSGHIIRTDKLGEIIWELPMTFPVESFFTDVSLDGDSIIVCGGIADGGVDTYDGYIYKCGIDGGFGWDKQVGREFNDYFNAVYAIEGYYSFGGGRSYDYAYSDMDTWMYRIDSIGGLVVDTTYINDSPNYDIVNDVIVRAYEQDYYFVGQTKSYGYDLDDYSDIFMGKMNWSYVFLAEKTYGEKGDDIGQAIDRTRDLGIVFLCDTKFFATGGNNILVIKLGKLWEYPDTFSELNYNDITNSIQETIALEPGLVYPNPFTDIIHLPSIDKGLFAIYSMDGKLIFDGFVNDYKIDLGNLISGTYLLKIETEMGVFQQRLIKN